MPAVNSVICAYCMAKHKKTLEQKKQSDMRHQVYSLDNYVAKSPSAKIGIISSGQTTIPSISYLKHDLLKTAILSSSILLLQIILSIALKNHVVKLPLVSY